MKTLISDEEALWAIPDKSVAAPRQILAKVCRTYNDQGCGIFWTPNTHTGPRRKPNLRRLRYFFVEMDDEPKTTQLGRIRDCPIRPSMVVESARGYHCYWRISGTVSLADWTAIERERLIPYFHADPKASDPLRLLRVPGYYHHKREPYPVLCRWFTGGSYRPEVFCRVLPRKGKRNTFVTLDGGAGHGSARSDLVALNGHWLMKGESFELSPQQNGNINIIGPDGDTGCFIDKQGYFGSISYGPPTILGWLRYYGWDLNTIKRGLTEVFGSDEASKKTARPSQADG